MFSSFSRCSGWNVKQPVRVLLTAKVSGSPRKAAPTGHKWMKSVMFGASYSRCCGACVSRGPRSLLLPVVVAHSALCTLLLVVAAVFAVASEECKSRRGPQVETPRTHDLRSDVSISVLEFTPLALSRIVRGRGGARWLLGSNRLLTLL